MTAAADAALPPIYLWALLGTLWMLVTAGLCSWHKAKIEGHPRVLGAILILVISLFVAAYGFGLGIALLFFIPPVRVFTIAARNPADRFADPLLYRRLKGLGIVFLIALCVLASNTFRIHTQRTTGEYIVQWSGAGPSRSTLIGLAKRPERIDDLRYVLDHTVEFTAATAATALAEVGDVSDLQRLEQTLVRSRNEQWGEPYSKEIETAVQRLRQRLDEDPVSESAG